MALNVNEGDRFRRLVRIVEVLRSEDGCPWDRKQTMESMVESLQEESREVVEAVRAGDMDNLKEELGDFILQGVFYAQMADEREMFDIDDVLDSINQKLVERHPHVFGEDEIETAEEALEIWEDVKEFESEKE
ncbi:MAG: MazG nucleotide pyrophosphohydrolase domain-containing protein [bacterium]